jgi:hypothetical protein
MNSGKKALFQIYAICGGKQCFFETVFQTSCFYQTLFPDFADLELFFLDFVLWCIKAVDAFRCFLSIDLKPKSKKSSGMAKNREKQRFKKVFEHWKSTGNSVSKKHWKSSKSSGICVDRTHPQFMRVAVSTTIQKNTVISPNYKKIIGRGNHTRASSARRNYSLKEYSIPRIR